MVSWKEQQEMHYDIHQTKLSPNGCEKNIFQFAINNKKYSYYDLLTCPFCLETRELHYYKKDSGLYECPNCHNRMLLRSLLLDLSTDDLIENFAKWVYEYRLNGFWKKIYPTFENWCKRLWELGIAFTFWEKYKLLKGNVDDDEDEILDDE